MTELPDGLNFAASHEWARLDADGIVTVGITDHAQEALGDVVYVELPDVDSHISAGSEAGVVESVKAASDIYAPISGTVTEVNLSLEDSPETVNESPYENGWFFKIKADNPAEMENLLDATAYQSVCDAEEH